MDLCVRKVVVIWCVFPATQTFISGSLCQWIPLIAHEKSIHDPHFNQYRSQAAPNDILFGPTTQRRIYIFARCRFLRVVRGSANLLWRNIQQDVRLNSQRRFMNVIC